MVHLSAFLKNKHLLDYQTWHVIGLEVTQIFLSTHKDRYIPEQIVNKVCLEFEKKTELRPLSTFFLFIGHLYICLQSECNLVQSKAHNCWKIKNQNKKNEKIWSDQIIQFWSDPREYMEILRIMYPQFFVIPPLWKSNLKSKKCNIFSRASTFLTIFHFYEQKSAIFDDVWSLKSKIIESRWKSVESKDIYINEILKICSSHNLEIPLLTDMLTKCNFFNVYQQLIQNAIR